MQFALKSTITTLAVSLLALMLLSTLPQSAQANNDGARLSDGRRAVLRP